MFTRILMMSLVSLSFLFSETFVTYEFSGGRFGDCLLCYLHGKWLSYKYQVPLLYKPFTYSDQLIMDEKERLFQPFLPIVKFTSALSFLEKRSCIVECPFFPEDPSFARLNPEKFRFDVDWKDKEFKRIAREMIAPNKALSLTFPPKESVNVAIHIREGGGYDTDHTRLWEPLKLPPLLFYIQGLLKILDRFPNRLIYCYLFTDALEPALLAEEFEKTIPSHIPLRIDYRRENNRHDANVLEDFFSFFHFDVLIHPQSNYSVVAADIGDFAITCSPYNFVRQGRKITITESKFDENKNFYQAVLNRTRSL